MKIPYGKQNISNGDIEAVVAVLKSDYLTQGPGVAKFEAEICKKVKSRNAITTNSATSALHIACLAIGVKIKDIVWTSPISFVASANCAIYCGAEVDFVDIDTNTGLMSMSKLRVKLLKAHKDKKLPKVVIPVHLAGTCCDMEELKRLSNIYGFKIIEDASHAIGGKYKDSIIGSCKYSDMCVFSLHPVKIITAGEGGILTTNLDGNAEKARLLRSHGIEKRPDKFKLERDGEWKYEQQILGYNYRMTDIHAALGNSQLSRLESFVERRNKIYEKYWEKTMKMPLRLLEIPEGVYSSVHLVIIRLETIDSNYHKKVFSKLREKGIGVQLHYSPIHLQPYYRDKGFKEGDFIESEVYGKNALSLPVYPDLKEEEQEYIINTLNNIL